MAELLYNDPFCEKKIPQQNIVVDIQGQVDFISARSI